jgi:chromosome segregation protein
MDEDYFTLLRMRLSKLTIAGFMSFVDPTTVGFPNSLTGVVGPNGCGKSNIIDAVRWVMGEISAKHLRGDSMADVIFNGSATRKPLGTASVELVFDNSDGQIGGAYAAYNEVALRRAVSRDGTSDYFINGVKVRRKDITQMFLGTGLGSRSYAIIEQGMISRIIEARPDDLRAFLEEAAGISRYKERRRETENRIGHTRENLDRLNDLREEVDKQIRHLQRQAATARRYQVLKEEQRKLQAEVLVLRLQGLDADARGREEAMRRCDTALQGALAELREVEAAIERIRAEQGASIDAQGAVQARYYAAGAEVTRIEQSIQYTRELRQRQRAELDQSEIQLQELVDLIGRDRAQVDALAADLLKMGPEFDAAHAAEQDSLRDRDRTEKALAAWQPRWDAHAAASASAQRETQVERARIEEQENHQRRLIQQKSQQQEEHTSLAELQPRETLEALAERAAATEASGSKAQTQLQELLAELSQAREREREQAQALHVLRSRWQASVSTQVSTDALQQAALGKAAGKVTQWLKSKSLDQKPRLAQQLRVDKGWERAVETVLGSYLEAVCVDGLDSVAALLESFDGGHLAIVSTDEAAAGRIDEASLRAKVQGAPALTAMLGSVYAVAGLREALVRRSTLKPGDSVVTRDGIWIGRDWLRLSRDRDLHSGVIEREEQLREMRSTVASLADEVQRQELRLEETRVHVRNREDRREVLQGEVNDLHREHIERHAALNAARARSVDLQRRRGQLDSSLVDAAAELQRIETELRAARGRVQTAIDTLSSLEAQRLDLEQERGRLSAEQQAARLGLQRAQDSARELAVQVESRRSSHASLATTLTRIEAQLGGVRQRRDELAMQLGDGDAPLNLLQGELEAALRVRIEVEAQLTAARIAAEELDARLRDRDGARNAIEQHVDAARQALEEARLALGQIGARREGLAEQFAATHFLFEELAAALAKDASAEAWETQLAETDGKLERLGQVNLAAIDEFKEQSERKEYLDRQFTDLTDALQTLESAMRKIDRETRSRFQDTFDRVNAGLKEKFPRLFGGGHAYLELTGEESADAGVSVMARPPGKRNSTISQLSGGEKALTAVALVFAIFELNPAPFCLLDEVDAPLDEPNVGRFCDIVRDMSRSVQFVFITHNRLTMEMASQLVGVTMNEPGVSRLVAVDVDEAVRMAAM